MNAEQARLILGISADASVDEARSAYLDLVKVWHPDRFADDARLQAKASAQLQAINRAYEVLERLTKTRSERPASPHRPGPPSAPERTASRPSPIFSETIEQQVAKQRGRKVVGVLILAFGLLFLTLFGTFALRPSQDVARPTGRAAPPLTDVTRPVASEKIDDPLKEIDRILGSAAQAARERGVARRPHDFLPSGTELVKPSARGLGRLDILNGTSRDAVLALLLGDVAQRAVYIRAGEKAALLQVAAGNYVARYSSGLDWDDRVREFRVDSQDAEFEKVVAFEEKELEDRTIYSRFELTLHRVIGGNARTRVLPPRSLRLPHRIPVEGRDD